MKAEVGDKVRLKAGSQAGERGIVEQIDSGKLVVRLEQGGVKVSVAPEVVTNFSLAARKAWVTGPDRAVGRKKGTKLFDRLSVTLRIDRDLWERFVALESSGTIAERTATINRWLRQKLAELDEGKARSECPGE